MISLLISSMCIECEPFTKKLVYANFATMQRAYCTRSSWQLKCFAIDDAFWQVSIVCLPTHKSSSTLSLA